MSASDLTVVGMAVAAVGAMFAYMKIALDRNSATEAERVKDAQKSEEVWRLLALQLLAAEDKRNEVLAQINTTVEGLRQALQARR